MDTNILDVEKIIEINGQMDKETMEKEVGILDPRGINRNPFNFKPFSQEYKFGAETNKFDLKGLSEKEIKELYESEKGKGWMYFKIYKERNLFFSKLLQSQVMLVVAGTGTGKTVIIPKLLAHYFGYKKKILITIPTIKAVVGTSGYAAVCMDVKLGEHVGHATQYDKQMTSWTKLLFCTTGYALAYMTGNPDLDDVAAIIIDEAHYREIAGDMLMSMACNLILRRPDFKLIVMSATITPKPFEDYFNKIGVIYQLYEPLGAAANYKIEHLFQPKPIKIDKIPDKMVETIQKLLQTTKKGHIVGFVTAGSQAKTIFNAIKDDIIKNKNKYKSIPWCHIIEGKTLKEVTDICTGKKTYIGEPDISGKVEKWDRKLILATEAVEASVTFGKDKVDNYGVDYVIESGIKFGVSYDPIRNLNVKGSIFVTQANIGQRCGRTGRTGDGYCIRMYTEEDFNNMPVDRVPQIEGADITAELIRLIGLPTIRTFSGASKFFNDMITPPKKEFIRTATFKLYNNNLLKQNGTLTNLGIVISKFGKYGIEMAKMIIASWYFRCVPEVLALAAIIQQGAFGIKSCFIDVSKLPNKVEALRRQKFWFLESSDHLSMLNVFLGSRQVQFYYLDKEGNNMREDKRRKFAEYHFVNYGFLEKVDKELLAFQELFKEQLANIVSLDLFRVDSFEKHQEILKKLKQSGGMNLDYSKNYCNEYSEPTAADFARLKELIDNSPKYNMCGGAVKHSKKSKHNQVGKSKKKVKKIAKKEAFDEDRVERMHKALDLITLQGMRKKKIKLFKNKNNNILACLFFGYYTQIGAYIGLDSKSKTYLIKHLDPSAEYQRATIKGCFMDIMGVSFPNFIIYNDITYENKFGKEEIKATLISRIPLTIINKFME